MRTHPFVESYLDAWNRNDAEAVGNHLAEDGVYRDVPAGLEQNRAELIESLGDFFQDAPHRYELLGEVVANDNLVAFQYRMVPIDNAKSSAKNGTASQHALRGAEFITLAGGTAASIHDYYQVDGTPGAASGSLRKYAKSGLSGRRIDHYKTALSRLMDEEALYLRPDLKLPVLARQLGCSVNHLSQVINAGFGMSFFDWVSQYRIRHAQELLRSPDPEPVLNIAYAVGFNSNSAFYTAFRKWVGTTPTGYRDAVKQKKPV